jgi:hypothetical protein
MEKPSEPEIVPARQTRNQITEGISMGKLRCLAAILAILLIAAPAALADTAPAPFTQADVEQISEGFATVGDYVAALSPTGYSWVYQGAATGETYLTLRTETDNGAELGEATISVALDGELIDSAETGERATLPEGLEDKEAWLVGARWLSANYALPFVRGVKPGAAQADVVAAFFSNSAEEPDYTIQDINPAVDETWLIGGGSMPIGGSFNHYEDGSTACVYSWCTLDEPDEWREYYALAYTFPVDTVSSIELSYFTDPE